MTKVKLKRGDKVLVIAGKDKGKEGKILLIDRKKNRIIVEGANMIKKHQKPNAAHQQGGIIEKEAAIHASNVMIVVNGKRSRIGYKFEDDKKVRISKSTNNAID